MRAHELHVWEAVLDRSPVEVRRLRHLLADDESARADRFRFERDRSRYTVGRGLLRTLLGRYLDVAPAEVGITYGSHEKPMLLDQQLWFNVTHSEGVALFAFSAEHEVGIDVELDQLDGDHDTLAERFFSPAEVTALRSLPASEQPHAFLTCWTRKEAFIKARGDGLSLPLDSFDVTLGRDVVAEVVRTAWSRSEPMHWLMRDISDPERGYVAALALRGEGCCVIRRCVSEMFVEDRDC